MKKRELKRQLKMAQIEVANAWRVAEDLAKVEGRKMSEAITRVKSMEAATTRMTEAMADIARAKSRAETAAAAAQVDSINLLEENILLRTQLAELESNTKVYGSRPECERLSQRPDWVNEDGTTVSLPDWPTGSPVKFTL